MRDSFTPEEVDRIENKAYEVGVGIGVSQERKRIIALLEEEAGQAEADSTIGLNTQSETIRWCIAFIKGENK